VPAHDGAEFTRPRLFQRCIGQVNQEITEDALAVVVLAQRRSAHLGCRRH